MGTFTIKISRFSYQVASFFCIPPPRPFKGHKAKKGQVAISRPAEEIEKIRSLFLMQITLILILKVNFLNFFSLALI